MHGPSTRRSAARIRASLVTAAFLFVATTIAACGNGPTVTVSPTQAPSGGLQPSGSLEPSGGLQPSGSLEPSGPPAPDSPSGAPSASAISGASATSGASAEIGPCGADDIAVAATSSGGAAGSRGADVSITAVGAADCLLPSKPIVAIQDANGQVILQSSIAVGADGPDVAAGRPADFTFEVSNWCAPTTATPWRVVLATAVGTIPVSGIQFGPDDLPPCNGPGQPALLTVSDWTSAAS